MKRKNPGYVMMYVIMILFFISFIKSNEILILTSILIIGFSIYKQKTLNLYPVIKPVLVFIIFILIPLAIGIIRKDESLDYRFYIVLATKVGISSILLGTFIMINEKDYILEGLLNLGMPRFLNRILALTYRYFFMINEDVKMGNKALVLRGLKNRNFFSKVRILGERIGGFFLKSADHGEKVYQAMKLRGFDGERQMSFSLNKDMIFRFVIFFLILFVILVIDWKVESGSFF